MGGMGGMGRHGRRRLRHGLMSNASAPRSAPDGRSRPRASSSLGSCAACPALFDLPRSPQATLWSTPMSDPLFTRFGREFRAGDVLFREGRQRRGDVRHPERASCRSRSASAARSGRWPRSGEASSSARWPSSTASRARRPPSSLEDAKCLVIDAATLEHDDLEQHRDRAAPREEARAAPRLGRRADPDPAEPRPEGARAARAKRHAEAFGEETAAGACGCTSSAADLAHEVGVDARAGRTTCSRACGACASPAEDAGRDAIVIADVAAAARVPRVPRDAAKGSRAVGARGPPRHRLPRRRDPAAQDERVRRRRPHRHRRRLAHERHGAQGAVRARGGASSATRTSITSATSRPSPTTAPRTTAEPLVVAGTKPTIAILKKHFFNGLLWPDFSKIPSTRRPAIRYLELRLEKPVTIAGYRVIAA